MRKLVISLVLVVIAGVNTIGQELSPYIKVGETSETMQQTYDKVIGALKDNNLMVLGAYNPSRKNSLKVIVFTSSKVKHTVVNIKDRGALAAAFKVGLVKKNGKIVITYTNPEYIFRAYLRGGYTSYKGVFDQFGKDIKEAFSSIGNDFTPYGGEVKTSKLKKYHYMMAMPYFTDPVELKEFSSFEEGLRIIQDNLKAGKGNTKKVYRLIYKSKEVAVFGVALRSNKDGESVFLPKIGEAHAAAMPYELILQGNKATMLHGKYRIALHWPELTMGTFMKIMSTPGDIEKTMKLLCE